MSYTKTNWKNGDIITAQKLNNAEAGILAGQNGYGYQEVWTTIYDGIIAQDMYYETAGMISQDLYFTNETGLYVIDSSDDNWHPYPKIRVTINGVSIILEQNEDTDAPSYGKWHYDESTDTNVFDDPCEISYHTHDYVYYLYVPDDTEREVKVEIPEKSMAVSDEFIAAVEACGVPETLIVRLTKSGNVYSSDKTYSELVFAMTEGKLILVFDDKGNVYTNPQISQDIYVADGDIIKFTSIWWNDSENGLTLSIFSFYQRNNEDVVSYAYVLHQ